MLSTSNIYQNKKHLQHNNQSQFNSNSNNINNINNINNNININNINSDSPGTQHSSSMSSITDEFDFKTLDISSSAQTSTRSPIRLNEHGINNKHMLEKEPRFSSFSFYAGPALDSQGKNTKKHASYLRKSLVISPSFNSITSNANANANTYLNLNDNSLLNSESDNNIASSSSEIPTKNIGMVISPSIKALSDILTSKVTSHNVNNSINATIVEENDADDYDDDNNYDSYDNDDNSTILFTNNSKIDIHYNKVSSLIDDVYSPIENHSPTFHNTVPDDTLQIKIPSHMNDMSKIEPDLIDLSSPIVENTKFNISKNIIPSTSSSNYNTNYSDIFESYSPVKSASTKDEMNNNVDFTDHSIKNDNTKNSNFNIDKRSSNRFSMISDNFNNFESPALAYSEPVQSFNFINPSIVKSFSKLSNISDSFHEIGYDNDDDDDDAVNQNDTDDNAFSFIPTRENTITGTNVDYPKRVVEPSNSPFVQKHKSRFSIRIVDEKDDKTSFLNEYIKSPNLLASQNNTPVFNDYSDIDKTPKLDSVPNLEFDYNQNYVQSNPQYTSPNQYNVEKTAPALVESPTLLNKSPIRNTSPTFERIKNSPIVKAKKNYINISPKAVGKQSFKVNDDANLNTPKSPQYPQIKKTAPPSEQPLKTKNKKLTFKSFFGKNTENLDSANKKKSPLLNSRERFTRPKSFSFNHLNNNNNNNNNDNDINVKSENKREKSKSLLSGWKRKSMGSSSIFNVSNNNIHSSSNIENLDNAVSNKNIKTHNASPSTASLPILNQRVPSPQQKPSFSPHRHSKSATGVFDKQLPELPPPISNANASLLQRYGFDNSTPNLSQGPILSSSPEITTTVQQNHFSNSEFQKDRTVMRSGSQQTIETSDSPIGLPEPQAANFDLSTPVVLDTATFTSKTYTSEMKENNENNRSNDGSLVINSSSTYETSGIDVQDEFNNHNMDFFQPPQLLGTDFRNKPPTIALGVRTLDENLLNTPPMISSPALSIVASFTSSPNKYHLGDDMFPKRLGADEIESIVSLERSKSMKSIRSNAVSEKQRLSHKNSILRMIHDNNNDFDEMVLPDGMVVVKSPLVEQASIWSKNKDSNDDFSRKSSILKKSFDTSELDFKNTTPIKTDVSNESSKLFYEQDDNDGLNDFIDMINFDDADLDNINTGFDIDTAMKFELSPVRKLQRDSSVPDFLGIETSYHSMNFADDINSENNSTHVSPIYTNHTSAESIEHIIKEEENLQRDFNYSTQSLPLQTNNFESYQFESPIQPISNSFRGLKGPSFNSTLKPETKSAIMGSLANQQPVKSIVPSESEISISHNAEQKEGAYDDSYNDYANYYVEKSPEQQLPTNNRYSYNNPFTDYTQSYDDDNFVDNMEDDDNNNYGNGIPSEPEEINDVANRRKTLNFMNKINTNKFGHLSTVSLPNTTTLPADEKPKRLTRRGNRSSISFSRLSMFDSLIQQKEVIEKPSVKFSSRILLYDTYGEDEYDRKPDSATCNSLTPQIALEIKNELNELKSEMEVHEDSKIYTHFF